MPRFAFLLVGAALLSACGESEREASCPGQKRVEPSGARLVTLFHETHTHGNLTSFAEYVGHLNALRGCLPDSDNSLFLGNGDDVSVGLGDVRTDGRHVVDAFNAAGLDIDTFGVNETMLAEEYDPPAKGTTQLRELVADSRFAWVSANVREEADPSRVFAADQGARRFTVEEVGGVRLAVTGLVTTDLAPMAARYGIRILDPVEAAREVVPEMQAAADVIVLLSHLAEEDTLRVVRSVDGIDAAVGTHDGAATEQASVVNGAIVAVAGPMDLLALGELSLVVRDGEVVDFEFRRHLPAFDGYVDRDVQAVIDEYIRRG